MLDKVQMKKGEINENSEELKDLKRQQVIERYPPFFRDLEAHISTCNAEELEKVLENTRNFNEGSKDRDLVESGDIQYIKEEVENMISMEMSRRQEMIGNREMIMKDTRRKETQA